MGTLKVIGYNYDECKQALAKMVIIDESPFNFVKGQRSRLFFWAMQPRFDISSRFNVMRDCLKLYIEEKKRLRTTLRGQQLCLTIDIWTLIKNYMFLTSYWIDHEWNLHKKFSIFVKFPVIWVRQLVKLLKIMF